MRCPLHTSLYTIYVEIKSENRFLLVHGYTGAMDLVGKNVVSFLREGGEVGTNSAFGNYRPGGDVVAVLKNRGFLTDLTPDEERRHVSGLAGLFHRTAAKMSSFLFLVAYDCNFTCPYCFEGNISGFGSRWSKSVMTNELVDRAYGVMLEINPIRTLHENNITLFGGEPLLEENHDIVSYIVGKGASEGYVFTAITNGYALDRYADILKPGMLQSLQISLDGTRDEHDRMRIHRDGSKTFDRIMENIEMALRCGVRVHIRVNTREGVPSGLTALYDEFVRRGWARTGQFDAYAARVHYPENQISSDLLVCASNHGEAGHISTTSYGNQVMEKICNGDIGYHSELKSRLERFFNGEPWALFRADYCGAETGMFVFDPNGDLYACLESVGMPEHRVGTYYHKLELRKTEFGKWRERKFEEDDCFTCKYLLFCGGGCPARSILENYEGKRSKCDGFPAVFRNMVAEAYREFGGNRNVPASREFPPGKITNFHNKERRET